MSSADSEYTDRKTGLLCMTVIRDMMSMGYDGPQIESVVTVVLRGGHPAYPPHPNNRAK